jgi:hypothetical protein
VSISPASKVVPAPNVHARRFDNEVVILDLDGGTYFGLDEIGAAIWECFLSRQCPTEIGRTLAPRYEASEEQLVKDACQLAEKLLEMGLVIVSSPEGGE